eukprot:TRINITY_DN54499_c0_g1_i1.p1 TRINITY_DN54499_c0_g1~~TRINITY_DN54499_c0_g1_i1.p1  ORF type:complete len:486 (-),score=258.48 TRINITY_DN54499_c0_g1_i1:42-1499(-)
MLRKRADTGAWFLKARAMTLKDFVDDTADLEEEGVAELLMDDNAISKMPRPGTSMQRPLTQTKDAGPSVASMRQSFRPMSGAGRPLTGFARPGTQSRSARAGDGQLSVADAFRGARPSTSRPVSVAGRFVRVGTASLMSSADGRFVDPENIAIDKFLRKPAMARALCDYLIYVENHPKRCLDLCAAATRRADFKDWWWKARLGKCYYQLGMYRDAERQFRSALKTQEMISLFLELAKLYLRLDQPNTALDMYMKATEKFPGETSLILGMARVYDAVNDLERGVQHYKKVLHYDPSNVEAIACLAGDHFYNDQPEVALRYYRRLLQVGLNNTELWCNVGLCCFFAGQYDMTLSCFERALQLADDDNTADVWYNIGHMAVGIGDLNLAFQAFKIAVSIDAQHAESFNNLGILELRKNNIEMARSNFETARNLAPHLFEPFYNGALLAYKLGDTEQSFQMAHQSLAVYPGHMDSLELVKELKTHFNTL